METNNNIENTIESVLNVAKNIRPVEPPLLFTDKVMYRVSMENHPYSSPKTTHKTLSNNFLWKVAAILVLMAVNLYTLSHILESPVEQQEPVNVSINDLVNDYSVSDANTDLSSVLMNDKTESNEQP